MNKKHDGMSKIVVFGGAGFIGSNLAKSLLDDGLDVTVFDSLARRGSETNLAGCARCTIIVGSTLSTAMSAIFGCPVAVRDADVIYHLALHRLR